MKYENLVNTIMKNIGGKKNVYSVTHCITRLRFKLKDESICNTEALKNTEGIVTVMKSAGQYQVVIGNHVADVYDELVEITGLSTDGGEEAQPSKGGFLNRMIDTISGVFQPVLGVLCAAGMVKGFLALFVSLGWLTDSSGTYTILYTVADGLFNFLPIFLGLTAARKFGVNQFVGMAIGAALVYPSIAGIGGEGTQVLGTLFAGSIIESNYYITFLGIPVIIPQATYVSTVIPVIVAVAVAAPLERLCKRVLPDVVRSFLTPFITLLLIVPATFIVIGPLTTWASQLIGAAVTALANFSSILAGAVVGGVWQILVIFGLHWGLIPIALMNITQLGQDPILAWMFGTTFAQTGAVVAIMLKTKDKNLRSTSIPAAIAGVFGVTEAAIYGVTLPRVKTFAATCISSAICGGVIGALNIYSYMLGGLGIFAYPSYINPNGPENHMMAMLFISLLALALGFVSTWLIYREKVVAPESAKETGTGYIRTDSALASPMAGEVIAIDQVKDDAFASGAIGKGVAIIPSDGRVYAPADGKVAVLFETKHAVCMVTEDGTEVMIHIGMDTVKLKGEHFSAHVKQDDMVKKGDLLVEVDIAAVEKEGYSLVTPVVVTNYLECLDVVGTDKKQVQPGDELIYVINEREEALVTA